MAAALVVLASGVVRPLPRLGLVKARVPSAFPGRLTGLAWPAQGQAAVAVQGIGFVGSRHAARSVPIASAAKVMTVYLVLREHPLRPGESGPEINVARTDVEDYDADDAVGDSVTPVREEERVTEFEHGR
jgi:D-alanyl-D-alanine carboxypeptidase